MAREFFRFGAGSKNFTRHNGKILARESQKTRTHSGQFRNQIREESAYNVSSTYA
nr:hypothetical protein [Porphyromonas gingivalis]